MDEVEKTVKKLLKEESKAYAIHTFPTGDILTAAQKPNFFKTNRDKLYWEKCMCVKGLQYKKCLFE